MTPIAFQENNTLFLNFEQGVVLFLIIALCITGTIYNVLKHREKEDLRTATLLQIALALFAVTSFLLFSNHFTMQKNSIEQIMLQQIQENYRIDDLRTVEDTSIICNEDYTNTISAIVWTEQDKQKKGLLVGKKVDNQCRFVVEETIAK